MSERHSSFSFSRFGRRLDQQKQTVNCDFKSFFSRTPPQDKNVDQKKSKEIRKQADWVFKKVDRTTPVLVMGDTCQTQLARDYNPHFEVISKHVAKVDFAKQTKRRAMSLNSNTSDLGDAHSQSRRIKLLIPFDLQAGRKEEVRKVIDQFYVPQQNGPRNNAHSFDSYSARKPIVQKQAMPDYDVIKSFMNTQYRTFNAINFGKLAEIREKKPLTALLDYDIKSRSRIQSVYFERQVNREQIQKTSLFRKIFRKVKDDNN